MFLRGIKAFFTTFAHVLKETFIAASNRFRHGFFLLLSFTVIKKYKNKKYNTSEKNRGACIVPEGGREMRSYESRKSWGGYCWLQGISSFSPLERDFSAHIPGQVCVCMCVEGGCVGVCGSVWVWVGIFWWCVDVDGCVCMCVCVYVCGCVVCVYVCIYLRCWLPRREGFALTGDAALMLVVLIVTPEVLIPVFWSWLKSRLTGKDHNVVTWHGFQKSW